MRPNSIVLFMDVLRTFLYGTGLLNRMTIPAMTPSPLHSRRQKETAGAGTPRRLNIELIHQRSALNLDTFI
jgi:hypothetical protein